MVGAAVLRARGTQSPASGSAGDTASAGPTTPVICRTPNCTPVATAGDATHLVELFADPAERTARLRVGGPNSKVIIDASIASVGVKLGSDSLQCTFNTVPAACLIRGAQGSGSGVAGEVVVAKGDQWRALEQQYYSDAGYLGLLDVNADGLPDLASAQYHCTGAASQCSSAQIYLRIFGLLDGAEVGCTNYYSKLKQLNGWPNPRVEMSELSKCE